MATSTSTATATDAAVGQMQLTHSAPGIKSLDSNSPSTTPESILDILGRDGGVILQNLVPKEVAERIKEDLKPHFDSDKADPSGFFPTTTQRATGLVGISPAYVEFMTTPILIEVANRHLTSKFTYFLGEEPVTVSAKPQISSTVGFRVNPGGKAQALHRDDADYHARLQDQPVLLGCILGISRCTEANGATRVVPGSHTWGPDRAPKVCETVPAELAVGDALLFSGHLYHGGGANITQDEVRENVGLFLTKGHRRQAENQYLMVPPEVAKTQTPQVQRLLGYGICRPSNGFYKYQDPMRVLFGVEDEDTVNM